MIITNPLFFKCLEKHGYTFHHSARGAGYRNKYYYWQWQKSNTPVIGYLKRYKGKYGRGYVLECVTDSNNICANHYNFYYVKQEEKPLKIGAYTVDVSVWYRNAYTVENGIECKHFRVEENALHYLDGYLAIPPHVENAILRALQGKGC